MDRIIFILFYTCVMLVTSWNNNGLCDVDKMKTVFSLLVEKSMTLLDCKKHTGKMNLQIDTNIYGVHGEII